MNRILFILLFFLAPISALPDNSQLLVELDHTINHKEEYISKKLDRIAYMKKSLTSDNDLNRKLKVLDDLYNEYYVFKFDSALVYADKGLALANKLADQYYKNLFSIHRAEILAIGGLYEESKVTLDSLSVVTMDKRLRFKYYYAYYSIFTYWADYSKGTEYSSAYYSRAAAYLREAISSLDSLSPFYNYYMGEYYSYVDKDEKRAFQYYREALKTTDQDSRIYAMIAFALSGKYSINNDKEKHEEYLIKAALCDIKCCTMETKALQDIALLLFQRGDKEIERAERYINSSMEDAKFYNNRLRILEISRIMPQIMSSYQDTVERQNGNLRCSVIFISLLVIGLLFTAYYIHRQNKQLSLRRMELSDNNQILINLNKQLEDGNKQQIVLNNQLKELNQRLVDTNKRREGLASIYIDLCAKYIDKLGKYQTLVKRKIKANQVQELLTTISSTRISEEDAAIFLVRFDKAFLELYPSFVEEFNALLQENGRIQQKSPTTLTTELRTFALIRLGVKSTADIAGLLFLSPQTIYNCRSVIKNKAIKKETFDEDVMKLGTV